MAHDARLIVTVDLELFGNGSGTIDSCACRPLERMTHIIEAHGGRLEIFVDALEFAVMERSPPHRAFVSDLRRRLVGMVQRGHKLQLHLHPQWDKAEFLDDEWRLELASWRIGDLDPEHVRGLVRLGYSWLQGVLEDADVSDSCSVFRAGGWCIQPSADVLMALREIGIAIDSSVAPEMMARDPAAWYDFSNSPERAWWPVRDDVMSVAERSDFLEVPITTGRVNPLKHVYARTVRRRQGELAEGCSGSYRKPAGARGEVLDILKKLSGSNRAMLDYCVLPAALLTQVSRDWINRFGAAQRPVPVVAIGHTKNFSRAAEESLDNFLRWATCAGNMELSSYEGWLSEANPDLTAGGGMVGAKNEHLI